jgi:hypothetical protein
VLQLTPFSGRVNFLPRARGARRSELRSFLAPLHGRSVESARTIFNCCDIGNVPARGDGAAGAIPHGHTAAHGGATDHLFGATATVVGLCRPARDSAALSVRTGALHVACCSRSVRCSAASSPCTRYAGAHHSLTLSTGGRDALVSDHVCASYATIHQSTDLLCSRVHNAADTFYSGTITGTRHSGSATAI